MAYNFYRMASVIKKSINKIFKNKRIFFLLIILLIGGFLRLYKLEDLMTYLGDEGRDMLIVMDIITGKNFPFIGPPTSVGELYLGPIYYYFITPFAFIFGMNPVGPAVFVALLGVLTIFLVYFVGSRVFGGQVGLLAAVFCAISPLTVKFSRSSWNPNPMPFFSLLLIIFLFYLHQTKKPKYLYLASLCFGIMLQLHYIAILLVPFFIFLLFQLKNKVSNKKNYLLNLLILLFLISPVLIFDLKHNFINTKGVLEIFKSRSNEGFSFFDWVSRSRDRYRQLFSLFFGFAERDWKTNLLVIFSSITIIVDFFRPKNFYKKVIYSYFIWGIVAVGLYRHSFYPHYLGFLFPLPAILIASGLQLIFKRGNLGKLISFTLFLLLAFNLSKETYSYLSKPPVLNVKKVKQIVRLIQKESNSEQFNFALLAKNNYDASYRYFFKLGQIPAVYQTEISKQLFVVCEDEEVCQPQGNPKWEIAVFDAAYNGNIKLDGKWQPDSSITVFKFVPN